MTRWGLIRKATLAIAERDRDKARLEVMFCTLSDLQASVRERQDKVEAAIGELQDWDFAYYCRYGKFPC